MALPKSVTMTRDGGFYWRAQAFNIAFTYPVLIPVTIALLLAVINPFWFRDDFFRFIERKVNEVARWRNYRMYKIYLGTDPEVWHTLKD